MDQETTGAALTISPTISGALEWHETTLRFIPEQGYLDGNTSYSVTIGAGATGADGEPILHKPFSWSFQTSNLQDLAGFGWGPNAQVLDADGRRAVQYQVFQQQPTSLTFELYQLSLEQFLDRYASGFRGVAGWEDRPISTDGARLVKSWQLEPILATDGYWHSQETLVPGRCAGRSLYPQPGGGPRQRPAHPAHQPQHVDGQAGRRPTGELADRHQRRAAARSGGGGLRPRRRGC